MIVQQDKNLREAQTYINTSKPKAEVKTEAKSPAIPASSPPPTASVPYTIFTRAEVATDSPPASRPSIEPTSSTPAPAKR